VFCSKRKANTAQGHQKKILSRKGREGLKQKILGGLLAEAKIRRGGGEYKKGFLRGLLFQKTAINRSAGRKQKKGMGERLKEGQ